MDRQTKQRGLTSALPVVKRCLTSGLFRPCQRGREAAEVSAGFSYVGWISRRQSTFELFKAARFAKVKVLTSCFGCADAIVTVEEDAAPQLKIQEPPAAFRG